MGVGFLPWEKLIPDWLKGPLLCIWSILTLTLSERLSWWEYMLLPAALVVGIWLTWQSVKRPHTSEDLDVQHAENNASEDKP